MSNNIPIKVDVIIDDSIKEFLDKVNSLADNGPFRKYRALSSAFAILEPANKSFYEYAYFERTLEWYIRDILINQSLMQLFYLHNIECLWPEKKREVRHSNEMIENIYPFEFIIIRGKEKIGFRYTGLCREEIGELIEEYDLSKIKRIRWENDRKFIDNDDNRYEVTLLEDVFNEYFPNVNFNAIFDKLKKAVEAANTEIGFETIPRLSLRYLSNFKVEVNDMLHYEAYKSKRFMMLPNSKNSVDLNSLSFSEDDYDVLNRNFVQVGLYRALLGNEGFAKCFITAEYQYQIFKEGNNFDYTSVISGYLKFIEQLVYKLMKIRLQFNDGNDLWIKCKSLRKTQREKLTDAIRQNPDPKSNANQILLTPDHEFYFDITLNPLIWFIHDDENGWYISDDGREIIHKFLRNFADECRNDHFHKDNIYEYEVVSRIRNNTILLAYLLLGGYKLSGNHQKDYELLGIKDDSFDRLFRKIQELPGGMNKFIISFPEKKPIKAYRHFTQEKIIYDVNGSVISSRIKFVEVDNFDGDEYDNAMQGMYADKELYLSQSNIPTRISYINGRNEEVIITW